jgi:nucleotide-binding universal stress UspA family protein
VIERIVVALDGSPESEHAVPITAELAHALGAAVTIVHVREMMLAPAVGGVPRRIDETEIEAGIKKHLASMLESGIDAELRIVASTYAGGPAHEIAEVAREVDAGLIVAGARGYGVIAGLLVGSVAHRLPYVTPCPVLTVPLPAEVDDDEAA